MLLTIYNHTGNDLEKFSLPSDISCFLIGCYTHFRVCWAKTDFTNGYTSTKAIFSMLAMIYTGRTAAFNLNFQQVISRHAVIVIF